MLGPLEYAVLSSTARLGSPHGMSIVRDIRRKTGCECAIGAVYTILERLLAKEFVSFSLRGPTPVRGGRSTKCYTITSKGLAAVTEFERWVFSLKLGETS